MNDPMRASGLVECNVVLQDLPPTRASRAGAAIRLHHGEVRSENPISISLSGDWIISFVSRLRCSRPFITAKKLPVSSYRYGVPFSDSGPTIALLNGVTTLPPRNRQGGNVRRAAT